MLALDLSFANITAPLERVLIKGTLGARRYDDSTSGSLRAI